MFELSKNLKVLALGAHPDDVELSCGGSLLKLKSEYKAEIYILIFTKGELKSNPVVRTKEQINAGKFLKVSGSKILNYKDGSIATNSTLVSEIERYIDEWKPNLVFTHCLEDIHQDHRNVAWATLSATRRTNQGVLFYPSMFTRDRFIPNFYVDITKWIDKKIEMLSLFKSQAYKEYMSPEVIVAQAKDSGLHSGCECAEEFFLNYWVC